MDWIRTHKSQATILGVFAAIAIALGVFLFLANSEYGESLEKLDSLNGQVASKEKASVYPSAANLKTLEEKVSAYEEGVGNLSGVLFTLQNKPEDIADTAFQAKLKQRIAETRDAAAKGNVKLPKDFAFGFDIYTVSLPPSPEASRDLNDYFESVDAVVTTAISAGIVGVDAISRTELDVEKKSSSAPKPAPAPKPTAKAKAPAKGAKAGKGGKPAAPPKPISQVVARRTLKLHLTTDQSALQTIINTLASPSKMTRKKIFPEAAGDADPSYFTVVRSLRIENEQQEGPSRNAPINNSKEVPQVAPSSPPPEEANGAKAAPAVEVITPPKPERADARMVLGGEKLHVYLEIDLIRFVEPSVE